MHNAFLYIQEFLKSRKTRASLGLVILEFSRNIVPLNLFIYFFRFGVSCNKNLKVKTVSVIPNASRYWGNNRCSDFISKIV